MVPSVPISTASGPCFVAAALLLGRRNPAWRRDGTTALAENIVDCGQDRLIAITGLGAGRAGIF
jgi:hypothetical protein